jgi:hypothetical protein
MNNFGLLIVLSKTIHEGAIYPLLQCYLTPSMRTKHMYWKKDNNMVLLQCTMGKKRKTPPDLIVETSQFCYSCEYMCVCVCLRVRLITCEGLNIELNSQ